jgi:hypothetical protein
MHGLLNVKNIIHILAFKDGVIAVHTLVTSAIINRWIIKNDMTLLLRAD